MMFRSLLFVWRNSCEQSVELCRLIDSVPALANAGPDCDSFGEPLNYCAGLKKFWYMKLSLDEKLNLFIFYNFYIVLVKQ